MNNKILIPVDGSANSDIAVEYGIYIAQKLNSTISALHVMDVNLLQGPMLTDISGAAGMPPSDGMFDAVEASLNEKADLVLKSFREHCRWKGLHVETKKVVGRISETIIEEARDADFIVMAKKGEHFHLKQGRFSGVGRRVRYPPFS